MGRIIAFCEQRTPLHAFCVGRTGALLEQPAGYPKLQIKKVKEDDTTEVILTVNGMTKDINGEHFYNWVPPNSPGHFKVRYEIKDGDNVYYGYDEIDVRYVFNPLYELHGAGDRFDIAVDSGIVLQAQFLKDKIATDPHSVTRVEIYNDLTEAEKEYGVGTPIETIESGDITPHGTIIGRFGYSPSNQSQAMLYYDKVYLIPEEGADEISFILPFYVRKTSVGIEDAVREKCTLRFDVTTIFETGYKEAKVEIFMSREWAWYGTTQVRRDRDTHLDVDDDGIVETDVYETDTMTADTKEDVYYTLKAGRYQRKFTVPKGTGAANIMDLPEYTE